MFEKLLCRSLITNTQDYAGLWLPFALCELAGRLDCLLPRRAAELAPSKLTSLESNLKRVIVPKTFVTAYAELKVTSFSAIQRIEMSLMTPKTINSCGHRGVIDVPGYMYAIRVCAVCGAGMGAV